MAVHLLYTERAGVQFPVGVLSTDKQNKEEFNRLVGFGKGTGHKIDFITDGNKKVKTVCGKFIGVEKTVRKSSRTFNDVCDKCIALSSGRENE